MIDSVGKGSMEVPKKHKKWTDIEDDIVIQCVRENPDNKTKALEKAAEVLEIDALRVKNRWYGAGLSKKYNVIESPIKLKDLTLQVRETMDMFIDTLGQLHKANKDMNRQIMEQEKRVDDQQRTIRTLTLDYKDLEDAHLTVMKIMEKARKMYITDELEAVDRKQEKKDIG